MRLLVIGGKHTVDDWTDSVESLDMTYVFQPHLENKVKPGLVDEASVWRACPSLSQPRSNFAATVISNQVYVYGGFTGRTQGHVPTLADKIEKYDPVRSAWEVI